MAGARPLWLEAACGLALTPRCGAAVERHTRALLEAAGRDPATIPRADVKHFCKHARYLR